MSLKRHLFVKKILILILYTTPSGNHRLSFGEHRMAIFDYLHIFSPELIEGLCFSDLELTP